MKNQQSSRRAKGFTLIELLVVITIIAVLAGLSFAGVNLAIKKSKKLEGQVMASSIATAVENYYQEYNRLPDVGDKVDTGGSEKLLQILAGLEGTGDGVENSRSVIFLQGKEAKSSKSKKGGIVYSSSGDSIDGIYDPFGNSYVVILNTNYDDALEFSYGSKQVRLRGKQVAVYSPGGDKELGTSDDMKTWD